MIHYFVTARQAAAMQSFLTTWGSALSGRVRIVTYESILAGRDVDPAEGKFIFTNLNHVRQLPPAERATVQALHDGLRDRFGAQHMLNDPARALTRYEFLRALHDRGINMFNAYQLEDRPLPRRFPVFIRNDSGTEEVMPALLQNAEAFGATMLGLSWRRRGDLSDLIAVEFCDTADSAGLYRKYSAFVVGTKIVPRHLVFGRRWMLKRPEIVEPALIEEEVAYLDTNPHAAELLAYAQIANIAYGRFDYAVLNGRLQIFEINTNSQLANARTSLNPERDIVNLKFVEMMTQAFLVLDQ